MTNRPTERDPAEAGIQASREDAQRAREATASRSTRSREAEIVACAGLAARALENAAVYLSSALTELSEAEDNAAAAGEDLDHQQESDLLDDGLDDTVRTAVVAIRALRDRRAARAGFSFED